MQNDVHPLKVHGLYGISPQQFTEKCPSTGHLYSAEPQKYGGHALMNSLHSSALDSGPDYSKVVMKENPSEGFRFHLLAMAFLYDVAISALSA